MLIVLCCCSCEVVRGIPAGLAEFVAPLQHMGLCRLSVQPTSNGLWTVYMGPANPMVSKARFTDITDKIWFGIEFQLFKEQVRVLSCSFSVEYRYSFSYGVRSIVGLGKRSDHQRNTLIHQKNIETFLNGKYWIKYEWLMPLYRTEILINCAKI
jgi:hypothetical protein